MLQRRVSPAAAGEPPPYRLKGRGRTRRVVAAAHHAFEAGTSIPPPVPSRLGARPPPTGSPPTSTRPGLHLLDRLASDRRLAGRCATTSASSSVALRLAPCVCGDWDGSRERPAVAGEPPARRRTMLTRVALGRRYRSLGCGSSGLSSACSRGGPSPVRRPQRRRPASSSTPPGRAGEPVRPRGFSRRGRSPWWRSPTGGRPGGGPGRPRWLFRRRPCSRQAWGTGRGRRGGNRRLRRRALRLRVGRGAGRDHPAARRAPPACGPGSQAGGPGTTPKAYREAPRGPRRGRHCHPHDVVRRDAALDLGADGRPLRGGPLLAIDGAGYSAEAIPDADDSVKGGPVLPACFTPGPPARCALVGTWWSPSRTTPLADRQGSQVRSGDEEAAAASLTHRSSVDPPRQRVFGVLVMSADLANRLPPTRTGPRSSLDLLAPGRAGSW